MSHLGTEETPFDEGETVFGVLGFGWVGGVFWFALGLLLFFSPHHAVFPSLQ